MNGSSALNEQLIGKFHVINVEKLDDILPQTSSINDETGCSSRFQMIRVDRNFGRGRWKVNDYEPPENISTSTIPLGNTSENQSISTTTIPNISTVINGDSNAISSTTLTATAASAAAAAATAFQQRMALNNTSTVISNASVPPPAGILHPYSTAALANQSYLLPNHHHHQFGYYTFYPPPYSPYAAPWAAAALAASNHYLTPTTNLNDPSRFTDTVSDINGENSVISSATYSNPTSDHLQNAQLAAAAAASFLYNTHHSHTPFVPQTSSSTSPYATIPSYHSVPLPPTIIPPNTLPFSQLIPNNSTDIQQSHQVPILTSPRHDVTRNVIQQSSFLTTPKSKPLFNGIYSDPLKTTHVNDFISSSPAITISESIPSSLISPITMTTTNAPTTSLTDIWTYTTTGSPLNITQTAAAAMGLLNNENRQSNEIANEILKELTTPTKQNNTTDIDNKISAAMDLVKMHLLSAVREEVTELRQKIRTLNEKLNIIEHENAFLRQHVSNEIYAQYIPTSNDSTNPSISQSSSSQPVPMTPLSSIPAS